MLGDFAKPDLQQHRFLVCSTPVFTLQFNNLKIDLFVGVRLISQPLTVG